MRGWHGLDMRPGPTQAVVVVPGAVKAGRCQGVQRKLSPPPAPPPRPPRREPPGHATLRCACTCARCMQLTRTAIRPLERLSQPLLHGQDVEANDGRDLYRFDRIERLTERHDCSRAYWHDCSGRSGSATRCLGVPGACQWSTAGCATAYMRATLPHASQCGCGCGGCPPPMPVACTGAERRLAAAMRGACLTCCPGLRERAALMA